MDGSRIAAALLILLGSWAATNAAAADISTDASRTHSESGSTPFLVAPVMWMLGTLGVPVEAPPPLPNSQALGRGQGSRELEFRVDDDGLGVYLEVSGRVEFEGAEVRLADGTRRSLPLARAVRGGGLYELCDFGSMVRVDAVVLRARARSSEARVGVRLGR
jgi:hypothetical protein